MTVLANQEHTVLIVERRNTDRSGVTHHISVNYDAIGAFDRVGFYRPHRTFKLSPALVNRPQLSLINDRAIPDFVGGQRLPHIRCVDLGRGVEDPALARKRRSDESAKQRVGTGWSRPKLRMCLGAHVVGMYRFG